MNIGLLTNFLALGDENDSGLGQHFRILADALVAEGHTVHVIHPTEHPTEVSIALTDLAPGWTWEVIDARPPHWLSHFWRLSWSSYVFLVHLWSALKVQRAFSSDSRRPHLDIIETHSYNLPALFLLGRSRRPKILTRVSTTMRQMVEISPMQTRALHWEARLERRAIDRSDALVTHTRQHRDIVCAMDKFDPARFHLVPHGVADPGPPVNGPPSNQTAAVEFLFVGRFEKRKGIDVLLAAIPEVAATFPSARFTLAGSRGDGADWNKFVAQHPELASTRVQSLGRVSVADLATLYRRCSVFVAPSRYESFGLIYVEAMSYAKPVIGCQAGGIPEVVQADVTGLLTKPGDVPGLATSMIRLAADADLRSRMGRAAREDFLARFSAIQLARASVELYREILASDAQLSGYEP